MTILLLETLHPDAELLLAKADTLLRARDPNVPDVDLADVRAILTRGRGRIEESLMAQCPRLAVIARAGAGLDNLDTAFARRRGLPVIYAPGGSASTVAEHTLALLLDLSRGITRSARDVRSGSWENRSHYHGEEICGLTLGIIGFGNIGRRVAQLASAFGMKIRVAEHRSGAPPHGCDHEVVSLDQLLGTADAVSLHLSLTPQTRGILGAREIAKMKPGALLINTARGALVDMHAVRVALERGTLGGFAADVLDVEPPDANDPLLKFENVVLTPHVASLTSATYRRICMSTAANVICVLRGEAPDPGSVYRR
ncbi:MAG: 2-hydroxyacid dehydrogenase [Planctomycetota bacterium]